MSGRKPRSPEARRTTKRQPVKQPGLPLRLLSAAGGAVVRHPKPLFGVAGFVVLFSFVAANALWYQPGDHPSPFLATRDPNDPNRIAGYRPARRTEPTDVTTFRIERAPDPPAQVPTPTAAPFPAPNPSPVSPAAPAVVISHPAPQITAPQQVASPLPKPAPPETVRSQPPKAATPVPAQQASVQPPKPLSPSRPAQNVSVHAEDPIAAAIRSAERSPVMTPPADIPHANGKSTGSVPQGTVPASTMVMQIQKGLSNIAYTDVETNGVAGEQTKAAIRRFEKHYGLPETGEPNAVVLKKLKSIGAL